MNTAWVGRTLFLFFIFCSLARSGFTQYLGLSNKVTRIIGSHCTVCRAHPADSVSVLKDRPGAIPAAIHFHNCLAALQSGDQENGYSYALETIMATGSKDPVRLYTRFLKARILYFKDGYKEALDENLQLAGDQRMDSNVAVYIYSTIASIYAEQQKFNKALIYFSKWENNYLPFTEPLTARKNYNNIGACYLHLQNFPLAQAYFQKSIAIAERLKDTLGLANLYINIGSAHHNQNLGNQAFPLFKKALFFAKRTANNDILAKAYQNMAIIEEKSGRFQPAYAYLKQYDSVIEIKWNSDNISGLKDKERELAVKEQEYKLELSQQQNKLQALELSKRNWQRNMFLILALLFLSFAVFIYRAYQQKVKRNKMIDAQREELSLVNDTKDQLFSIISHDLRTLVYTLKVTLTRLRFAMMHNQMEQAAVLAENTERVSGSTYALLNNLLHWALSQTGQLSYKPERLYVKEIVDEVYNDLLPVANACNIQLQDTTPDDLYFTGDSNSVKIILRNLVDNAIKYTPANGEIILSASRVNQLCHITVQDSGAGMDQSIADAIQSNQSNRIQKNTQGNRSTGLGLWLVKTMTEKNGGTFSIHSQKETGTSVTVSFPLAA